MNLMVTAACNSRCTTCNIWKEFKSNPSMIKDELSHVEIVKIFRKLPKTVSWLSLTGGEPFMRKDIPEIIDAAIRHVPNLRLISIPSNGLLQDRILKTIRSLTGRRHPDIILTFSVDGPEAVHDKIRGLKGAFKKTWDTYTKARRLVRHDNDFQVAIETTISAGNAEHLLPFHQKLLDKGHKIAVTVAHDAYLYKNEHDKSFSPRKKMKEVKGLVRLFDSHLSLLNPQTFIERQYLRRVPEFLMDPKKRVVPCEALVSSFAMDSRGNMTPCLMWGMDLGNVREHAYSISKIWKSKKFKRVRNAIKAERCPNCWTPCEAYQSIFWAMLKLKLIPR